MAFRLPKHFKRSKIHYFRGQIQPKMKQIANFSTFFTQIRLYTETEENEEEKLHYTKKILELQREVFKYDSLFFPESSAFTLSLPFYSISVILHLFFGSLSFFFDQFPFIPFRITQSFDIILKKISYPTFQ